jgi:hypothetical protein
MPYISVSPEAMKQIHTQDVRGYFLATTAIDVGATIKLN